MRRLEVPGNILLLGEYAILEEGGLGVVLAIDRKIGLTLEESDYFEIKGQWGDKTIDWTPGKPESDGLIDSIYQTCLKSFQEFGITNHLPSCKITIDTKSYRTPSGQKYGLGASAAVSCGLTRLLFSLVGLEGEVELQFKVALYSHRHAQGTRGSGYDIATSLFGGMGLFRGGREPLWKPLNLPWLPPGYLFAGPKEVPTISALSQYYAFKAEQITETDRFLSLSNDLVEQFVQANNWRDAMKFLSRYREESIHFQKKLQIEAHLPHHPTFTERDDTAIIKALGAGNELGSLWGNVAIDRINEVIPVHIWSSGPKWVTDESD